MNAKYMPEPVNPIPEMFPSRVPIEDWSDRREVTDRLTPYNWLYIQTATVQKDGEEQDVYIPPAMHALPESAMRQPLPLGRGAKEAQRPDSY